MIVRSTSLILGFLMFGNGLFAQLADPQLVSADDVAINGLTRLSLPAGYSSKPLPYKKDNSRLSYFPPIYNQGVWNCNQASSIWTMFTYEINFLRGLNSTLPENQYSPMPAFNMLNYGNPSQGVSYFDSWNLLKANGTPGSPDYATDNQNWVFWMTDYEKYYRAMKNRVDDVFAIDVGTPDGLLTLKHWLNDHLEGSEVGGLANFQIGSGNMIIPQIPLDKGLDEEGQYIVIRYGPYVGHAMTFAGWNDSVRYDYNGDGKYTNHIDINGDGIVSMKDWEIGAMLVVNSWGMMYNAGKLWVMYRLLAETTQNGGIWKNAAMVVKPKKTYEPQLTVKAKIRYNQRNRLKIQVGLAADPRATVPDRTMDFPCFNFQGDTLPMQGFVGENTDLIEIGLDITPIMNYFPESGEGTIFLEVIQKSPDGSGEGRIEAFSVMDYTKGVHEYACPGCIVPIRQNAVTRLSLPVSIRLERPLIYNAKLPDAQVGVDYQNQLFAGGTTGPYRFANPDSRYVETSDPSTIDLSGGTEVIRFPGLTSVVKTLPFKFPFFGEEYDQLIVLADGGIVMGPDLVNYPYVIDTRVRFYQYNGIFPFLGDLHYSGFTTSVTLETTEDQAIVRWHAFADPGGLQPLEFAARLLSDGTIGFFYGDMEVTPDIPWISGISAGDNQNFSLLAHNATGIRSGTGFILSKLNWPSWLALDSGGNLQGIPEKSGIYSLPIRVTDWNGIVGEKEMTLTVNGGSGVAEQELSGSIGVYPNPASGEISLRGFAGQPGTFQLTVYDVTGNQILQQTNEVPAGDLLIPIQKANALSKGVYLYQIQGVISGSGRFIRQ